MKIMLCHLALSLGPQERNLKLLARALELAGQAKADWVITPETAVQGYHFHKKDLEAGTTRKLDVQPAAYLRPLRDLVRQQHQYLFLGAGEWDEQDACHYNTCFVFGPDGELVGKHRKNHSHGYGGEGWITNSQTVKPIQVGPVSVGVMICSDAWYPDCPKQLADQGADILVDIAGWPISKECGDPLPCWLDRSRECALPLVLCNQTGKTKWLDFTVGQSVYIENGELKLSYAGDDALLFFEWDERTKKVVSQAFTVVPFVV